MTTGAIVTMVGGIVVIWGGLATSIWWAWRSESHWTDDD